MSKNSHAMRILKQTKNLIDVGAEMSQINLGVELAIKALANKLTAEDKFWVYVDQTGPMCETIGSRCWVWNGTKSSAGYGKFYHRGTVFSAHRFSWELHNGRIPNGNGYHGSCILHNCDNRACVNPQHLEIGDQSKNMKDMAQRGRWNNNVQPGEDHPSARLTWDDVNHIRSIYKPRVVSLAKIARMYNVSLSCIRHIIDGTNWKV